MDATFTPVTRAFALLRDCEARWSVAGGWAIDLFLGAQTRSHSDLDLAVLRADQWRVRRHLSGFEWRYAVPGQRGRLHDWADGKRLEPPIHEVHAQRMTPEPRALEILLNEAQGEMWHYRRDPAVTMPLEDVVRRTGHGIPYLVPEVVLLYKAREPAERDNADFAGALPRLEVEQRRWLRRALDRCHPGHAWAGEL